MTESEQIMGGATNNGGPSNLQIGYFLFRLTMGVNIFFHGFMRPLTGLTAWESAMSATFVDTYLPMPLVHLFLLTLPFFEIALGTLIILGLFTRWSMIAGAVMMLVLLYGNTARQDWGTAGNNMHYTLYFWVLLALEHHNWLALDKRRSVSAAPA